MMGSFSRTVGVGDQQGGVRVTAARLAARANIIDQICIRNCSIICAAIGAAEQPRKGNYLHVSVLLSHYPQTVQP